MVPTCLWYTFWFLSTRPIEQRKRVVLLITSAFLQGASIGSVIELTIGFDQSILVAAFVGTALEFGCFSAAAMLSRRRKYIYLGALLSSDLSVTLWLHFASMIFGGSAAIFQFQRLHLGLMLFVGYLVLQTQIIIGRAHQGDLDYVQHSLDLFDLLGFFVRFVIFMFSLKNFLEKFKNKKRDD